MYSPDFYNTQLRHIQTDIKLDLVTLLIDKFGGCYTRDGNSTDPYIKLSNIIGSPIIYEIKVGDDGKILYKSGMWSGNFLISTQSDYYELFNDSLFEVYKTLYKIVFGEDGF